MNCPWKLEISRKGKYIDTLEHKDELSMEIQKKSAYIDELSMEIQKKSAYIDELSMEIQKCPWKFRKKVHILTNCPWKSAVRENTSIPWNMKGLSGIQWIPNG